MTPDVIAVHAAVQQLRMLSSPERDNVLLAFFEKLLVELVS